MLKLDLALGLQAWEDAHRLAWEARHGRLRAMRHLSAARQAAGLAAWAAFAADGGARRRMLQRGARHGLARRLNSWRAAGVFFHHCRAVGGAS